MIRCLVGIVFATLGFGAPQITLTPYGYANTLDTSTPFQIVSVSSSPNTTVTLTLSESWIRFQSPSSSGCTNLVATVPVATTATPKAVYGCLLSAPAFASLYTLVGASARGFASVSQPVPIKVYPVGDLVISPSETTLTLGETKTIAVSVSV